MRLALCLSLIAAPLWATEPCTEDAMIVFDGSGSMAEMGFNQIDEPRIFEARRAMRAAIPDIAAQRRLGLLVYGPGGVDECSGIDLRFTPMPDAAPRILGAVDGLQPAGDTALTEAVSRAAAVLDEAASPGVIVLVTDGKETCNGQPCQLAAELAADRPGLRVHVIGFKVRGDHFGWSSAETDEYENSVSVARCLAEQTGGEYVNTETVDELVEALRKTLGCSLLF